MTNTTFRNNTTKETLRYLVESNERYLNQAQENLTHCQGVEGLNFATDYITQIGVYQSVKTFLNLMETAVKEGLELGTFTIAENAISAMFGDVKFQMVESNQGSIESLVRKNGQRQFTRAKMSILNDLFKSDDLTTLKDIL